MRGVVCGVGIRDIKTRFNGEQDRFYTLWLAMMQRCYSENRLSKRPTYENCEVSDDWKTFSKFRFEVQEIPNSEMVGWELDKDILFKGNKIYSKETCCFVPHEINSLIIRSVSSRKDLPIGVRYRNLCKNKPYEVNHSCNGRSVVIGYFETPEEGFLAYKLAREDYVKSKASEYSDVIDERVYEALMKWTIESNV